MEIKLKRDWRLYSIFIFTVTMGVGWFLGRNPQWCEEWYARFFYLNIRKVFQYTLGQLPFAAIYLLLFLLLGKFIFFRKQQTKEGSLKQRILNFVYSFVGVLCILIASFQLLWGYNYLRVPLKEQMGLQLSKEINVEELRIEAELILEEVNQLRKIIGDQDTFALSMTVYPHDLEREMRESLQKVLVRFNYPADYTVRGRELYPSGLLLSLGASGIYLPYSAEGHVDAALPIVQKAFTLAHEMAHAYGFGNEGVCNFLAYLACMESVYPAVQYSGKLMHFYYVFSELKYIDFDTYKVKRMRLATGASKDLARWYKVLNRYPPLMSYIQSWTYDIYLKAQGVTEGLKSYDQMVLYVKAYREQY